LNFSYSLPIFCCFCLRNGNFYLNLWGNKSYILTFIWNCDGLMDEGNFSMIEGSAHFSVGESCLNLNENTAVQSRVDGQDTKPTF